MVFTTGRGSCFGCKPAPSIKIATNTPMSDRMAGDMDLNAGEILHGKLVTDVGARDLRRNYRRCQWQEDQERSSR